VTARRARPRMACDAAIGKLCARDARKANRSSSGDGIGREVIPQAVKVMRRPAAGETRSSIGERPLPG